MPEISPDMAGEFVQDFLYQLKEQTLQESGSSFLGMNAELSQVASSY